MRHSACTRIVLGTLAALVLGGCHSFKVSTPEGFVSLHQARTWHYYKAVATDNSVVTVSSFRHRDRGSLGYWADILRREMTLQKGYQLTATKAVKTRSGLAGQRLAFIAQNGATTFTYEATLFVTKKWIHVVEAAAKQADFAAHQAAFEEVVASLRPK
jgi:hypothetical protein